MKTSIACLKQPRKWHYRVEHFQAISRERFRYISNDIDGLVLDFGGKWTAYNLVRERVPSLPELTVEYRE